MLERVLKKFINFVSLIKHKEMSLKKYQNKSESAENEEIRLNPNKRPFVSKAMQAEVKKACEVMEKGGVILYPTDTVWGIGCDATNAEAVKKVYELKHRSDSKAMLVLVDSDVKVNFYVKDVPEVAWQLIDYATKPLTVIYEGARNLAENLIAEDGSVGIRITKEVFSNELCYRFKKAIVSTSANISGEPSPATFKDIGDEVKNAVDYIVNCRQNEHGCPKPSSIVKVGAGGLVKIIRK